MRVPDHDGARAPAARERQVQGVCKAGGDGLLACNFCTAVYHNSAACLGEAQVVNEALAKSASFPWACPACFKKGVAAVQRVALKPTGQRAAGAKTPRSRARSSASSEQRARLCGSGRMARTAAECSGFRS